MSDEKQPQVRNYRRTLPEEDKEKFAYELALGYYDPEELRHVMKIVREGYEALMASDDIKVRVMRHKRQIDESPDALRIHARRAARIAIEQLAKLVEDAEAPAKTRMEAGRQLREYAMVADKEALEQGGDGPTIIRTNLDLQGAKGVYQIRAEDIAAQEAENEQLAETNTGDVSVQFDVSDDFADLLGVTDGGA